MQLFDSLQGTSSHLKCFSANAFTIHKFWKTRYQTDPTVHCPYGWCQTGHLLCPLKPLHNDNFTSAQFPFCWVLVTLVLELDYRKLLFFTSYMPTLFPSFLPLTMLWYYNDDFPCHPNYFFKELFSKITSLWQGQIPRS